MDAVVKNEIREAVEVVEAAWFNVAKTINLFWCYFYS